MQGVALHMQDVYLYAGFIRSYAGWTEYASVVGQGFSLYYCTVGPVERLLGYMKGISIEWSGETYISGHSFIFNLNW